jgi:hypothetical protein
MFYFTVYMYISIKEVRVMRTTQKPSYGIVSVILVVHSGRKIHPAFDASRAARWRWVLSPVSFQ